MFRLSMAAAAAALCLGVQAYVYPSHMPRPEDVLLPNMHSLPWSATSKDSFDKEKYNLPITHKGVANMVMRNKAGAPHDMRDHTECPVIRSGWLTNGVCTVYFDAVNAYTTNSTAFNLQVEVSTNAYPGLTEEQSTNVVWRKVMADRYYVNGDTMTKNGSSEEIQLDIKGGCSLDRFYRIIAHVGISQPCRVRIRRVSYLPGGGPDDWHGFAILDNIILSWPPKGVDLGPNH